MPSLGTQAPGCVLDLKDVKIAKRTSLLKQFIIQQEDPNALCNHVIYASRVLSTRYRSSIRKKGAADPVDVEATGKGPNRRSCHMHSCTLPENWWPEQPDLLCVWKSYQKQHRYLFQKEYIFGDTEKKKRDDIKQRRKADGHLLKDSAELQRLNFSLAAEATAQQSLGEHRMHPTTRVKIKMDIGEMVDNGLKRQEAPSGIFLLSTLHMSKASLLDHRRGLRGVDLRIAGMGTGDRKAKDAVLTTGLL